MTDPYREPAEWPVVPSSGDGWKLGVALAFVALGIGGMGWATCRLYEWRTAPCETFIGRTVDEVPPRCLHPTPVYLGPRSTTDG